MVTDTIIEKHLALQHARVPTAAGFSIISYSLKKMGKKLLGTFCNFIIGFYNSPLLHFFGENPDLDFL